MLVMSMLNIVGAARLRINFGMGVSVILRNCSALRSAFAMKKPRFLFDTIFSIKIIHSSIPQDLFCINQFLAGVIAAKDRPARRQSGLGSWKGK